MPSFWIHALLATIFVLYTAKRDSNPAALFPLLLIAVPPLEANIPLLFGVHHQRLLILILLLPMAWRLLHDPQAPGALRLLTDKILPAYMALLKWSSTGVYGFDFRRCAFLRCCYCEHMASLTL